jgi:hypothetical protein
MQKDALSMKIRKHEAAETSGRCTHCGAAQTMTGGWGERTCNEREDGTGEPRPSGARIVACEDSDTIVKRIAELRVEADRARFGDAAAAT